MPSLRLTLSRALHHLQRLLGRSLFITVLVLAGVTLLACGLAFGFFNAAPPTTLTISSGPPDSAFARNAERYKAVLAKSGVTLKILPSEGSHQNLARLIDPKQAVDVGFVLSGEAGAAEAKHLVSLGSVAYQPLMIFYRGPQRTLLSEFKGLHIDIGPEGSGTHTLALELLKANGIEPGDGTTFPDAPMEKSVQSLREGKVDALFAMGDSTSAAVLKQLLHTPGIRLYHVAQAEGYVRKFNDLTHLLLPRGGLDFGQDIPNEDVHLIGPTVELAAREGLHPALSDLLLEASREVNGKAGLFRRAGEFPRAQAHDLPLSEEANRWYTSGKSFLYRSFPFWLASLITRILAVLVPLALVLIPGMKVVPVLWRWWMSSRIYRWYGVLQEIEHDARQPGLDAARRGALLHRLAMVEASLSRTVVPPAFGDLLYHLRGHIEAVRKGVREGETAPVVDRGLNGAPADAGRDHG